VQTEDLKTSETLVHPMALKKQGDTSKLRDMLIDTLTRLTGMTESSNTVQFLMDRFDENFALKIFPRGKDCEKSEKEFKHEMEMNILAL
jgi:hypothetical protein